MKEQQPRRVWLLQLYGTQTHWRGISHLYSGCRLPSSPSSIFLIIDDPHCLCTVLCISTLMWLFSSLLIILYSLACSLACGTAPSQHFASSPSSPPVWCFPLLPIPLSFQFFPAFHLFCVRRWSICSAFAYSTISSSSFAPDVVLKIRDMVRNTGPVSKVCFFPH